MSSLKCEKLDSSLEVMQGGVNYYSTYIYVYSVCVYSIYIYISYIERESVCVCECAVHILFLTERKSVKSKCLQRLLDALQVLAMA